MKALLALVIGLSSAFAVFYLMFFKLAPTLCEFFALNSGLGKLLVYGIIGYFGGITIPIIIIILTIGLSIALFRK